MISMDVPFAIVFLLVCFSGFCRAGGIPPLLQQETVQGSYAQQHETKISSSDALLSSEVEYVDGPLVPLYDFLIERRLTKFCKLLRDAALEETLTNLGSYWTLFVPSDSSFFFLPGGTLETLKRNPQQLRDFILYHFVSGDLPSSQIVNELLVDSVQGAPLRFNIYGQVITVSGAQIVESDLQYELGRVHIVDRPLHPIPSGDTVSYLSTSHKRLYRLLLDAGLTEYLSSGTFTILAPDDDAFDFLSAEFKDALSANRSLAQRVLLNHILPGSLYIGGITDGMQWETVGGDVITFTTKRGLVFANEIPIVLPDIPFTNGVIQVLNRVLLPDGVEFDCQCKPSTTTPQRPPPQAPGQTQRTNVPTTRRPSQQPFPRQTPRPSGRQTPGTLGSFDQRRPISSQTTTTSRPTQRPFNPPLGRPQSPGQSTDSRTVSGQPVGQSFPEDDLNSVLEPNIQIGSGQKRPEQSRTTRFPPPPVRRTQPTRPTPRVPTHSPRFQQPRQPVQPARTQSSKIPEQPGFDNNNNVPDVPPVTQTPQTNRWDNRQSQAPRYPTPPRGAYHTSTTRSFNQVTQPGRGKIPDRSTVANFGPTTQAPLIVPQKPSVTSWQQRNQVSWTTRQQPRSTRQPSRVPPVPQSPLQPRPGSFPTPAPIVTDGPFESNRQTPPCRKPGDQITPATQNLPICPESPQDGCQNPPFNPRDSRPLCPSVVDSGCRQSSEPFNPSDTRPLCPLPIPGQGCRNFGEPTYVGDRRPICSPSPPSQVGCRDPSSPFNPSDNRPLCVPSTPNDINPSNDISRQDCRRTDEPFNPQDVRPQCPSENQPDCRPFNERPTAGDRRPLCRTNNQVPQQRPPVQPRPPTHQRPPIQQRPPVQQRPPTQQRPPIQQRPPVQQRPSHVTKGQTSIPGRVPQTQRQPAFQPNVQSPASQTTRRPSWQPTQAPQEPQPPRPFNPQNTDNIAPVPGGVRPSSSLPQRPGSFQPGSRIPQPQTPNTASLPSDTGNLEPPSQDIAQPIQPQLGSFRPSNPPVSRPYPTRPQAISRVSVVTQPPRSASQGPFPSRTPTGVSQPPQSQVFQINRPGSTPSVSQPFTPQRPQRPQVTPSTSLPGRSTSTPRIPVSVTGTSATSGEDSRRSLYEIVEDPALLIQGQPVKLTKILSLFQKAGIENILTGPGPTTVFLPSDDAFAALPQGVVDQLEENPELLRQILLYHVTTVEILPSAQSDSYTVPTMEGTPMVITMLRGGRLILISGAKAIAVTRANNGIFYVINQLLYPLPHPDIVGAVQSRPDLSILSWFLSQSGLNDVLTGESPHTLLAPTDNAFAQLPNAVYEELTRNTTALQEILMNHIIDGAHYGREFFTGPTFPSARGGKLKFQVVSYGYQVNEVNVKTPEIVTGSGVIHLIDQVLLDDADLKFLNTLENSIAGGDGVSANGQQLPRNDFQQNLGQPVSNAQRPGNQPIFDIQRIPQGQPQVTGLMQPPTRQQTNPRIPTAQLPPASQQHNRGQTQGSGQRPSQTLRTPNHGGQRPGLHDQRQSSVQALPSSGSASNVADLARTMGLNRFANWITNTGLLEKIHDGGVYTVFAPTDDAVNALPQEMSNSIDSSPEQTKSLLQYHIIPQRVNLNSLTNEETSSTLLQGQKIRFNVYQGAHINCKQVVTASGTPVGDALATMGSIQLIPVTQVLYQPTGNLLNIIEASPILQNLAQAIRTSQLTWMLSGSGPLTFFAPSDTAFQSLSPEERKSLIDNKQAFTDLLKRHLVRGTYFSSGVQEDLEKKSDNNQPMKISLNEGVMTINSVPVSFSDITATNGVLHVIDQFLR